MAESSRMIFFPGLATAHQAFVYSSTFEVPCDDGCTIAVVVVVFDFTLPGPFRGLAAFLIGLVVGRGGGFTSSLCALLGDSPVSVVVSLTVEAERLRLMAFFC